MKASLSILTLMTLVVAMTATAPTETMAKSVSDTVIAITPNTKKSGYSKKQIEILNKAYTIAKNDGHPNPSILQGIVLKESKAGAYLPSNKAQQNRPQFGVAQVKIIAVRAVFEYWPNLWKVFGFKSKSNSEIKHRLITDTYFNLSIASKYLKMLRAKYNIGLDKILLIAYNQGPSGLKQQSRQAKRYAMGVLKLANSVSI